MLCGVTPHDECVVTVDVPQHSECVVRVHSPNSECVDNAAHINEWLSVWMLHNRLMCRQ